MKIVRVFDVVKYILKRMENIHSQENVTAWKLQKIAYYCQVWHIVWKERPLFQEKIEAWVHGPVCRVLYNEHKGKFTLSASSFVKGNISNLNEEQREVIDKVVDFYGLKSATWLSNLTHLEHPWQEARKGLPLDERGNSEITHASIMDYYADLPVEVSTS